MYIGLFLAFNNGFVLQFGYGFNPIFPITFREIFCALACVTQRSDCYAISIYNKTINGLSMYQWQTAHGGIFQFPAYWIALGV